METEDQGFVCQEPYEPRAQEPEPEPVRLYVMPEGCPVCEKAMDRWPEAEVHMLEGLLNGEDGNVDDLSAAAFYDIDTRKPFGVDADGRAFSL